MNDDHSNVFIYRVGSPTNVIGRPCHFYRSDQLRAQSCQFGSVYAVREEDASYIQETSSVAGFKGIVWSARLWVDFDNEEGAAQARKLLKEKGLDYVEYTTGGRGAHFGIARDARPSHILPALDRHWVKENLPGADLSLYWHLHLIRLPGAVHERTGKRKEMVERVAGTSLVLTKLPDGLEESQELKESGSRGQRTTSIFKVWGVVSNLQQSSGLSRHKQLVNLAAALKGDANVTIEEALWICCEVNRGFTEPKPDAEVERIVSWAYGR